MALGLPWKRLRTCPSPMLVLSPNGAGSSSACLPCPDRIPKAPGAYALPSGSRLCHMHARDQLRASLRRLQSGLQLLLDL